MFFPVVFIIFFGSNILFKMALLKGDFEFQSFQDVFCLRDVIYKVFRIVFVVICFFVPRLPIFFCLFFVPGPSFPEIFFGRIVSVWNGEIQQKFEGNSSAPKNVIIGKL